MKVLVTGAAGFVGSHLCEALLQQGWDVIGLDNMNPFYDPEIKQNHLLQIEKTAQANQKEFVFYVGDVRHQNQVAQIFRQHDVSQVFHLASMPSLAASFQNPRLYAEVNVQGTLNLLEECRTNKIQNFIFASDALLQDGIGPLSVLTATQKAAEDLAKVYCENFAMSVLVLRLATVYGARQRPDQDFSQLAASALMRKPVAVVKGEVKQNYVAVTDVTRAFLSASKFLEKQQAGYFDVLGVGSEDWISQDDVVKAVEENLKQPVLLAADMPTPQGEQSNNVDVIEAKTKLNFSAEVSLNQGLTDFLAWKKKLHRM